MGRKECLILTRKKIGMIFFSFLSNYDHEMREKFFLIIIQVWIQKCAVQKASVDVNISYY
jgi:hypothetical protein